MMGMGRLLTVDLVCRADAELLGRLRALRAEMVARGLRTELDDKWSEGVEEVEGV